MLGEIAQPGAVHVHNIDLVISIATGNEGNAGAIRRPGWRSIAGGVAGQVGRFACGHIPYIYIGVPLPVRYESEEVSVGSFIIKRMTKVLLTLTQNTAQLG